MVIRVAGMVLIGGLAAVVVILEVVVVVVGYKEYLFPLELK